MYLYILIFKHWLKVYNTSFPLLIFFCSLPGTPAMTSRGCLEADFETIADFLLKAAQITNAMQREHGKLQKGFHEGLQNNKEIVDLRNRVEAFASQFAMPGFDTL